jgi:hypothetical protein
MNKLAFYLIAAVAIIAIILVAFVALGNFPPNAAAATGTLRVSITDAPVDLSKLEVTIDSLEVQSQSEGWVNVPFIDGLESVRVDLLSLQSVSQDLSTTQLPAGNYTKMRLHVRDATATYKDGTTDNLNVPSDKIDVIIHFEIEENATTNVLLDMSADTASISNGHNLKPVLKASVVPSTTVAPTPSPTVPAETEKQIVRN